MVVFLNNLEADAEGALVLFPVGAEHLETADLRGAAYMLADAGTDVVVADTHQADGVGGIVGQTGLCHRQISIDELVHTTLYLLLLLTTGLLIEMEAHLALFPLDMGIVGALTPKEALHGLIQQMFGCMCGRKLLLVMLIEYIIGHIFNILGAKIRINPKKSKCFATF